MHTEINRKQNKAPNWGHNTARAEKKPIQSEQQIKYTIDIK